MNIFQNRNFKGRRVKVSLDLFNYATKADLKIPTGVDTSEFAKEVDLADIKPYADKLDIHNFKHIPTTVSNFKSKLDKLDVNKLVPVPVDLGQLTNLV